MPLARSVIRMRKAYPSTIWKMRSRHGSAFMRGCLIWRQYKIRRGYLMHIYVYACVVCIRIYAHMYTQASVHTHMCVCVCEYKNRKSIFIEHNNQTGQNRYFLYILQCFVGNKKKIDSMLESQSTGKVVFGREALLQYTWLFTVCARSSFYLYQ